MPLVETIDFKALPPRTRAAQLADFAILLRRSSACGWLRSRLVVYTAICQYGFQPHDRSTSCDRPVHADLLPYPGVDAEAHRRGGVPAGRPATVGVRAGAGLWHHPGDGATRGDAP